MKKHGSVQIEGMG